MSGLLRGPSGGRSRGRGQSLVEFALVIPLILLVILGIVDLGRGVYTFTTLAEAARQANRLAIVDQNVTRVKNEAIAYAPTLGLTTSNVDVCFKASQSTQRDCANLSTERCVASGNYQRQYCLAIVTARTTFAPITPLISVLVPSVTLSSSSVGPIEYACPNAVKTTTCP